MTDRSPDGPEQDERCRAVAEYYAARAQEYDRTAGYMDTVAEQLRTDAKNRFPKLLRNCDVLEIACGTGYWTSVVAQVARSVLATDACEAMVAIARRRLAGIDNVRFQVADAYSLEGVPPGFTAAFAVWWWSHIPRHRIPRFLAVLHSRLLPGARVLFVDQLPSAYTPVNAGTDADGNQTEDRTLSDGRTFRIVKNFPSRDAIRAALGSVASDIEYREFPGESSWSVYYRIGG